MKPYISSIRTVPDAKSIVYIIDKSTKLDKFSFTREELNYIRKRIKNKKKQISINRFTKWIYLQLVNNDKPLYKIKEDVRKAAYKMLPQIKENNHEEIILVDGCNNPDYILAFAEGLALSNYQFLKYYKKDAEEKKSSLKRIRIFSKGVSKEKIEHLQILTEAVYYSRTLVNEPLSFLTAVQLGKEIQNLGSEAGFKVEVFNKKKIESLKMGGLLAVNKGSIDPPTFSVLEWKPEKPKNTKPLILVGKGVVFDTGGLSLKPTKDSMDYMKSDMSGAASVACVIYAVARAKLPVHVIGLVPATDNRPDGNAYAPGDVIDMYGGLTVEVLNTDAEGRMILADALSYAKQYNPQLVIDLSTLTGAAAIAIGKYGIVGMGNADSKIFDRLIESGKNVYERIVEFPSWEEYDDLLKSDIADIKNVGGRYGGAITAGKFLEKFTDYPYIHLDIAGPAFLSTEDSYRGKGGTGTGVRLLFDFIENYTV
jgi:leucyl aminopeptidase